MPNKINEKTMPQSRMNQQFAAVHSYLAESINYATHGRAYNTMLLLYHINCLKFTHLIPVVNCLGKRSSIRNYNTYFITTYWQIKTTLM